MSARIVGCESGPTKAEVMIEAPEGKVIQVDVRILPSGKIIVEAEHLTGEDPSFNGVTLHLEDDKHTAVLNWPHEERPENWRAVQRAESGYAQ